MKTHSQSLPKSIKSKLKPLALSIFAVIATPNLAFADAQILLPPEASESSSYKVSGDGSTVFLVDDSETHASIYQNGNYSQVTVPEAYDWAYVFDTSRDGSVWLGESIKDAGINSVPVIWNNNVPTIFTEGFTPEAISDDGSIVAGRDRDGNQGILWHLDEGLIANFTPPQDVFGVRDLSGDGTTVIGSYSTDGSGLKYSYEAYRWSEANGFQSLGTSPGFEDSSSTAVNRDGSVVVGYEYDEEAPSGVIASRWSEATGIVSLGALDGHQRSMAFDVNADGSVVVGYSKGTEYQGFRWTEATGMISIDQWLTDAGVELLDSSTYLSSMTEAYSVSDDGEVILGRTTEKETGKDFAVLARVSEIGSGIINRQAFNRSVQEAGAQAVQAGSGIAGMTLFGAHHRTLLDNGLTHNTNKNTCMWATADHGRDDVTDTDMSIAEAGVCKDIGNTRIGVGVGKSWSQQDWNLGGSADYNGQYLLVEAAHQFDNGFQPSILGMVADYDTEMTRHYQNGAVIDRSEGSPDADAKAIRLRGDWKDLIQIGQTHITPYAAYTWIHTHLESYTETGGGFPTQYDANDWYTSDLRLGAAANYTFNGQTNLRFALEGVRRLDEETGGTSGQILGLGDFNVEGVDIEQNWARALVDVDHKLNANTLLTVGANAAGSGDNTNWGITAGIKAQF